MSRFDVQRSIAISGLLTFTLAISSRAQQTSTAEQPASASGPSLAVTLQFIADKISDVGLVVNDRIGSSSVYTGYTLSNVRSDLQTCKIMFHIRVQNFHSDGTPLTNTPTEDDVSWDLRHIATFEVATKDVLGKPLGNNGQDVARKLPLFELDVKNAEGKIVLYNPVPIFHDETMAARVGKAFVHAGQLCGSSAPEPF